MRFRRPALALFLAAIVGGCAAARYHFEAAPPPPEGFALVYLYRVFAAPIDAPAEFTIDTRRIAALPQRGYTWAHVPAGVHTLRASWPTGSRGTNLDVNIDAGAGRTYYYRLGGYETVGGRRWYISGQLEEIAPEEATRELRDCCRRIAPVVSRVPEAGAAQ